MQHKRTQTANTLCPGIETPVAGKSPINRMVREMCLRFSPDPSDSPSDRFKQANMSLKLIAPLWARQPWISDLVELARKEVILIPEQQDIKAMQGGRVFHLEPRTLSLAAWLLRK